MATKKKLGEKYHNVCIANLVTSKFRFHIHGLNTKVKAYGL